MLPERIMRYLENRGLSADVIKEYGIGWDGQRIVIPVHDADGKVLFNKYRRDPGLPDHLTTVPKYSYDKGAASALFGTRSLAGARTKFTPVVLCEGEFDALVLISNGMSAVSSTGGAKTFSPDMAAQLRDFGVVVCYDNDQAGVEGAFRVLKHLPDAKIAFLPEKVGKGGDVTDFVRDRGMQAFVDVVLYHARNWALPPTDWFGKKKKDLVTLKRSMEDEADLLLAREREFKERGETGWQVRVLIDAYLHEIDRLRAAILRPARQAAKDEDALARAKAFPISDLVRFDRQKKAKCLWHDDSKPSMHYYENSNHVHCFSCGARGDAVDVVMKLENLSFPDAVRKLAL